MTIDVERDGGVQIMRFNRPDKKNAITLEMYEALAQALDTGEWAEGVHAHMFAGLPGAFTAGNDLNDFLKFAEDGALAEPVLRFLRALPTVKKPMIAVVDGLAVGLGTTMLFHCDLVYASPNAEFRTPFLDLGVVPEAGSSLLMPYVMGHARAFEMLCLGKAFGAERAMAAGFVNEIVPADELEAYARQAAARLAARPPEALAGARELLRGAPDVILARIEEEAQIFGARLQSDEAREAIRAVLEKRPPDFRPAGSAS